MLIITRNMLHILLYNVILPKCSTSTQSYSNGKERIKNELTQETQSIRKLFASGCMHIRPHLPRFSEQTVEQNSITFWRKMQMNHNMGWEGIKDPSLINDKPGWNPLFRGSAIGKLQVLWQRTHKCGRTCWKTESQAHIWHDISGCLPALK